MKKISDKNRDQRETLTTIQYSIQAYTLQRTCHSVVLLLLLLFCCFPETTSKVDSEEGGGGEEPEDDRRDSTEAEDLRVFFSFLPLEATVLLIRVLLMGMTCPAEPLSLL